VLCALFVVVLAILKQERNFVFSTPRKPLRDTLDILLDLLSSFCGHPALLQPWTSPPLPEMRNKQWLLTRICLSDCMLYKYKVTYLDKRYVARKIRDQ